MVSPDAPEVKSCGQHGNAEIREVPSEAYPSIAAATADLPARGNSTRIPQLVIRLAAGTYAEPSLTLSGSLVLEGARSGDGDLPVLSQLGSEGLQISGSAPSCSSGGVVLRRLRLQADDGCPALSVCDASPLVESCELVGAAVPPGRGARAGLHISGASSRPTIRDCEIWGHSGAGVLVKDGATAALVGNEVRLCGCGFWLDSGTLPLLWRNSAHGNVGAGVVARAGCQAKVVGNAFLRNGCGALVESDRTATALLAYNVLRENRDASLRQSNALRCAAADAGVLSFENVVSDNGSLAPSLALEPSLGVARDAAELLSLVRGAPSDRPSIIQVSGVLELREPLVLNKPVVIRGPPIGAVGSRQSLVAELRCVVEAEAVVVVTHGGEASALCRIAIKAGGSCCAAMCVDVKAGQPCLLECDLAATPRFGYRPARGGTPAHTLNAAGPAVKPLLVGCTLRGAEGAGVNLQNGASVSLLRCELAGNCRGVVTANASSYALLEECRVLRSCTFGIDVGPGCMVSVGRCLLEENSLGSLRLQGCEPTSVDAVGVVSGPSLLDECKIVASDVRPAFVVGSRAACLSWQSVYAPADSGEQSDCSSDMLATVRVENQGELAFTLDSNEEEPQGLRTFGEGCSARLDISKPDERLRPQPAAASAEASSLETEEKGDAPTPLDAVWLPVARRLIEETEEKEEPAATVKSISSERQPGGVDSDPQTAAAGKLSPTREVDGKEAEELVRPQDDHQRWLGGCKTIGPKEWQMEDTRHLYALLAMIAAKAKCPELLSIVGLGGPISSGELVYIRAHTARYVSVSAEGTVTCKATERGIDEEFFVMSNTCTVVAGALCSDVSTGTLQRNDTVTIEVARSGNEHLMLSLAEGTNQACALPSGTGEQTFKIVTRGGEVTVDSGAAIYLRSSQTKRLVEVKGEYVHAGPHPGNAGTSPGTRQRFFLEKILPPAMVPAACADRTLTLEEQAWLLRRGVRLALVRRQHLAGLLSGASEPAPSLLKAFAALWEAEWRAGALAKLQKKDVREEVQDDTMTDSPATYVTWHSTVVRATAELSSPEVDTLTSGTEVVVVEVVTLVDGKRVRGRIENPAGWISLLDIETGNRVAAKVSRGGRTGSDTKPEKESSTGESEALSRIRRLVRRESVAPLERENGDLIVSALRSFFADALHVAQLEANNVMRIVEAFAAALVADKAFLNAFSPSMLPEDQRMVYKTPEEVLFGLAYTVMMLNTDVHSKQVKEGTWNQQKFVAAGKDCGVQAALMSQIFKRITENEL
eukprot:TRINITY_DN49315_c0_g1_i1.p1 TRINITY_DN49315_c0_g1~~TRINITY_DN49315_c0_g1_i1.p1  ORF type:complete len:1277 (-),score=256.19 TRINITY_DN49315_c0_g1_i1:85-3915(-)